MSLSKLNIFQSEDDSSDSSHDAIHSEFSESEECDKKWIKAVIMVTF